MDKDFIERYNPLISLTTSHKEILDILFEIDCQCNSQIIAFEDLVNLCYYLVCRVPIPLIEIDAPFLLRARPNYQSVGKIYSHIGDLSYNPILEKIIQGRFNIEKEPVFYACVPCHTPRGDTALSAIVESSKDILEKEGSIEDKYSTVSKWYIKKTFFAINFSMYDQAQKNNLSVRKINNNFLMRAKTLFSFESLKSLLVVCRFMAIKAANKNIIDKDYLITNAFKKALEKYYGIDVKAVIYSSAMSEHNGLNIAVSKKLIDDGDIAFDGACVYKIMSHHYKLEKMLYPCSNYAKADSYGNFKLKLNTIRWLYN